MNRDNSRMRAGVGTGRVIEEEILVRDVILGPFLRSDLRKYSSPSSDILQELSRSSSSSLTPWLLTMGASCVRGGLHSNPVMDVSPSPRFGLGNLLRNGIDHLFKDRPRYVLNIWLHFWINNRLESRINGRLARRLATSLVLR
jgi:hypothetical protein